MLLTEINFTAEHQPIDILHVTEEASTSFAVQLDAQQWANISATHILPKRV